MAQEFDGTVVLDQTGFAFSTPAGPLQLNTWPRYAYHATEATRLVSSEEEFKALGEGWSLQYIKKDYPKMMFAPDGETRVVNNPEEEAALASEPGGPWADAPHGSTDPMRVRGGEHTLQSKAEAIRDSRRLSLDYVQLNQDLDTKADNVAMRAISAQDVPRPQFKPVETADQIRKRREEEEEKAKKRREEEEQKKSKR